MERERSVTFSDVEEVKSPSPRWSLEVETVSLASPDPTTPLSPEPTLTRQGAFMLEPVKSVCSRSVSVQQEGASNNDLLREMSQAVAMVSSDDE